MAIQDYHNTGEDTPSAMSQAAYWKAQTFTTNSAYTIVKVKLYLTRATTGGLPAGDLTVSIRATTAGVPSGNDLASVTIDANTISASPTWAWYDLEFDTSYALSSSTVYAIVARNTVPNANNYIQWYTDGDNGYANGIFYQSTTSGVSWNTFAAYDGLFETYDSYNNLTATNIAASSETGAALTYGSWRRILTEYMPTYDGNMKNFVINDLTASRLVASDANKKFASVTDLTGYIAGTANEIDITDDGDGTLTIGIVDPLIVAKGGTGATTLTDGGILLGSGTGAITALGQATNGQLPIGSTGADPVLAELTGTANQITVSNGAGTITLSLPQDIHTGASPTFAGGTFTGTVTGVSPTLAAHLATKEYVDLSVGTQIDFFFSDTASGVGSNYLMYPIETGGGTSTLNSSALGQGNDQLCFSFLTEAGQPGINFLREGVYSIHAHLNNGVGHKATTVYATISYVDSDGSSNETLVATSEATSTITSSATGYDIHAAISTDVDIDTTKRVLVKFFANVGATGTDSTVTITMEGTSDSHVSLATSSEIYQRQGAVLDDLNTLGASTADGEFLVATGAGALAWESGATARTSLGLAIGTNVQAWDAGLDSLAALTYASDSFIKVTATDTYAIRTIAETKQDLSLDAVENTALSTWAGTTNITTLGTIGTGTWNGTTIAIANGGTGQTTQQAAIDALTNVSAATNEHVLTKDTVTGNAIWKAASGADAFTVKVDAGATADYIGAASSDGVLRTGSGLSYTDGGNYVTIARALDVGCYVKMTSNQSLTDQTWTTAHTDTEGHDLGSDFDNATNYRFTVDTNGYYLITGQGGLNDLGDGKAFILRVQIDAAGGSPVTLAYKRIFNNSGGVQTMFEQVLAGPIYLTSGQTIDFQAWHNHGSARNLIGINDGTATTWVSVTLVAI